MDEACTPNPRHRSETLRPDSSMLALVCSALAFSVPNKQAVAPALRLRGGEGLNFDTKTLNMAAAIYHGMYGIGLYADPNMFADSGKSPIAYTADAEGPVGRFMGRSWGAMMTAMACMYWFDLDNTAVTKMFAVAMALITPIMFKCIENGGDGDKASFKKDAWKLQVCIHVPFTAVMLLNAFG